MDAIFHPVCVYLEIYPIPDVPGIARGSNIISWEKNIELGHSIVLSPRNETQQ